MSQVDLFLFLVTNILTIDILLHFYPIYMFIDKLGDIDYNPTPTTSFEENLKSFAIYTILEIRVKAIEVFVCYLIQKAAEKAF